MSMQRVDFGGEVTWCRGKSLYLYHESCLELALSGARSRKTSEVMKVNNRDVLHSWNIVMVYTCIHEL
jgi:hypothetical protein